MSGFSFDPIRFLMRRFSGSAYERARRFESEREVEAAESGRRRIAEAARAIHDEDGVPLGVLPAGSELRIPRSLLFSHALVVGASGSGKTRFLLGLFRSLSESLFLSGGFEVELELVDPKYETYDLFRQALASLWLRLDAKGRERLASRVAVLDWTRDAVSPVAPYAPDPEVSVPFLAQLRADVTSQAGGDAWSEPMKQGLFMLGRLLIAKGFPPSVRFVSRLLRDEGYRRRIVEGVPEPDVRAYFEDLDHHLPKLTANALLRRLFEHHAFPEIRCSEGIPPAKLAEILPKKDARITLGNFSPRMSLPASKAIERANHRIVDVLLRAPRRDVSRPALLVIEEAPALLSQAGNLIEPLATAARTLRSAGLGLLFVAQDFGNSMPSKLAKALALNARWLVMFRSSREDAELVAPHVLDDPKSSEPEIERRRAFVSSMANLPPRRFIFHAKGRSAIPLHSLDVPDPGALAGGVSEDRLREVFEREIASRSMVATPLAARLIEEWEAEVVDGIRPAPARGGAERGGRRRAAGPAAGGAPKSVAELLFELEGGKEKP